MDLITDEDGNLLVIKPIYTHVADDGTNTHIDTQAIRQFCIDTKPEIFSFPIRLETVRDFLLKNTVSRERCAELLARYLTGEKLDPVIIVKDGTTGSNGRPNVLFVDGHHRYVIFAALGRALIDAYVLEYDAWQPFRLTNVPDVTAQQLKDTPITKRNY